MKNVQCPKCKSEKIYKECTSKFNEFINSGEVSTFEVNDDGLLRCSNCNHVFNENGMK